MAEAREIRVKLTVDVSEYMSALERAKTVTQELLDLGIEKKDLPQALATVTRLAS